MAFDDPTMALPEDPQRSEEDLQAKLAVFVQGLQDELGRRKDRRASIEQRWLEDLRQYHGTYSLNEVEAMQEASTSQVFLNLTATKTDGMEARIFDLLFPTDERNWGIGPTPVPELTEAAKQAAEAIAKARRSADAAQANIQALEKAGNPEAAAAMEGQMRDLEGQENAARQAQDALQRQVREAAARARLMETRIADYLAECRYPVEARKAIGDGCKMGFGVIKGPILSEKPKKRWTKDASGRYQLKPVRQNAPGAYRVDPWKFYPDPDVRDLWEGRGFYEVHFKNKSQLREMAKMPHMRREAIRALLQQEPDRGDIPSYLAQLHALTGQHNGVLGDRYQVVEYTGPVDGEQLRALAEALWKEEDADRNRPEGQGDAWMEDIDELEELQVRVWFCQGQVLSFELHPLDSGQAIYHSFTIREDEASPFGYGIPWIMRHPQAVLNSSFRMLMDNAALATGPQILINKDAVEPQDGDWTMRARKAWLLKTTSLAGNVPPFQTFNIEGHQAELQGIITLAAQTIDEVTAMPKIAEGEQGAGVTKTAQGMALLMNSANVTFRRIVKNWDDGMTTPLLQGFHDWEMQFGQDENLKGDYDVVARGASVLLLREMQAQNLMVLAQAFGDHPVYGAWIKHDEILKTILRALMLDASELTLTAEEHEEKQAEMAQNQPQDPKLTIAEIEREIKMAMMELERERMQVDVSIAEMNADAKKMVAQLAYDQAMIAKSEDLNMEATRMELEVAKDEAEGTRAERRMAAEIAMKQRTGDSSGGSI